MSTTTRKAVTLGLEPSFGFGDRLGLATPGHLDALQKAGGPIKGIFAQQSIREMTRTNRTPVDVMQAALRDLDEAGFDGLTGADADHLKVEKDVDVTAAAGFVFFTIDPSDHVDDDADSYDDATLHEKFAYLKGEVTWEQEYRGKSIQVPDGPLITFDDHTVNRAAVKYGRAIEHSLKLAAYIDKVMSDRGADYEIEMSVDETPQPTTLAEHYIIADQLLKHNVKLVSLAPRYIGEFEKGIDYKGDLKAFEDSLSDHAAIARHLGPYKLSLHSGSDKLSIYPIFARVTKGLYHVKTAGTSYLEALRVAARHDGKLFRRIVTFSRSRFETDKATYHISAALDKVADEEQISDDAELERLYLNEDDGRQILHVTFGSVLTHPDFGPALKKVLVDHPDTHKEVLSTHFQKHLNALCEGWS